MLENNRTMHDANIRTCCSICAGFGTVPQAQQIFACVNNNSGAVKMVSNATCNNNEKLVNVGGALAGADYQCVPSQPISPDDTFSFSSTGVSFGSGISTAGGAFTSFALQPGIYQIHLSGTQFTLMFGETFQISARLNGINVTSWFYTSISNSPIVDIVG
jgi:hypothetical protein